jgi:very-short-patch-repair endonuclease
MVSFFRHHLNIFILNNEVVFRQHKIKRKFYDFFLPKYNLLIERDGEQHYGRGFADLLNISQKENQIQQQTNDKLKTKMAKDAGFKIARIPYWLTKKEEEIEIENILAGKPTYPDVPDLKQEKTRPKPKRNF